jgi:nicotinamidase-related amidase
METNKQNTALLVMDMQNGIVPMLGASSATIIASVGKAIANARAKKIPVIYVVVGFRNGFPEVSANNKGFSASKERFAKLNMEDFMKVESSIAPQAGDVTVTKRRVSAFTGSDLEVVLRAQGIQHIILTGIATSGVVLSTLREAADKDYRVTVLSDGCADGDEEIHRVLTTKVFPRQADVVTIEEWSKN